MGVAAKGDRRHGRKLHRYKLVPCRCRDAEPNYLSGMPKTAFEPCLPKRGTKVPAGPDWIHEIKHDGYRMIVQREGKRVRLFTRNGHDWTARHPLIVEAALRNRTSSFVVDGEAVLLGVDHVSRRPSRPRQGFCRSRSR